MAIKKYRVIKEFWVYVCDEDCSRTEEEPKIEIGNVYEFDEQDQWKSDCDIWLEHSTVYGWLDLDKETFEECFEELK